MPPPGERRSAPAQDAACSGVEKVSPGEFSGIRSPAEPHRVGVVLRAPGGGKPSRRPRRMAGTSHQHVGTERRRRGSGLRYGQAISRGGSAGARRPIGVPEERGVGRDARRGRRGAPPAPVGMSAQRLKTEHGIQPRGEHRVARIAQTREGEMSARPWSTIRWRNLPSRRQRRAIRHGLFPAFAEPDGAEEAGRRGQM